MNIPAITFLKEHERLVIVVLVLVFGFWGVGRGLDAVKSYQENKASKLEQQLAQTQQQAAAAQQAALDAKTQVLASQTVAAQDKAASAAIIQALSAQNAALNKAMVDRGQQTQKQQQTDLTASIPELGKRFITLVPSANPADIKVAADQKSVTIGEDTAQKTVAQLELVPQLQQDKKDLQTEVDNANKETESVQKALNSETRYADTEANLVAAQEKFSALLQKTIDQGDKVCDAKIAIEKTNTKKAFMKGFKIGGILGFIAGIFGGHAAGI